MTVSDTLAQQLTDTRDWTLKLLADLSGDDWSFQPGPGLAHAQYLIGHLAVSQNVLVHVRCLGTPVLDEAFCNHFPIGGPIPPVAAGRFPPVSELLACMAHTHGLTLVAVRAMSDALLREPAFGKDGTIHPHYEDKLGAVSHCIRHEAFHAGQISTIRRLLGKSFLR